MSKPSIIKFVVSTLTREEMLLIKISLSFIGL